MRRDVFAAVACPGRNEPVLAHSPARPWAGEVVVAGDPVLQQGCYLVQRDDVAGWRGELLAVFVVDPIQTGAAARHGRFPCVRDSSQARAMPAARSISNFA